mmetsp:Transcript_2082/g.5510  ORF Transcript_2082/g.5510 Transcript_2082/m.5510 type:complete len:231 (+) Transcript_2082:324-1016(+)
MPDRYRKEARGSIHLRSGALRAVPEDDRFAKDRLVFGDRSVVVIGRRRRRGKLRKGRPTKDGPFRQDEDADALGRGVHPRADHRTDPRGRRDPRPAGGIRAEVGVDRKLRLLLLVVIVIIFPENEAPVRLRLLVVVFEHPERRLRKRKQQQRRRRRRRSHQKDLQQAPQVLREARDLRRRILLHRIVVNVKRCIIIGGVSVSSQAPEALPQDLHRAIRLEEEQQQQEPNP